jgi:hypothetical protein
LDLLIRLGEQHTALELKYLVAALHATASGELFDLPNQSANDIGRYDVIKDITRGLDLDDVRSRSDLRRTSTALLA